MNPEASRRFSWHLAAVFVVLVVGCSGSATDPDPRQLEVLYPPAAPTTPVPDFALPAQSFGCRSLYPSNPGFTPEQFDEIASMPMAIFQLRWCLSPEAGPVIEELRRRNPDIVILGAHQVLSVPLDWGDPGLRRRFPMNGELYDLLIDRTASSSTGEPLLMWDGAPMINPMHRGRIDRDLLTRLLNVISRWATEYPGRIDGVMHDYTSPGPWAWPEGPEGLTGIVDFDGDGIAFDDDPDEIAAWRGWQYALADEFQDRFGEGFIQVGNGRLVLDDPEMARRLAGATIQKFPFTVWDWTAQEGLDVALRLREAGWLTPRRGHYWNVYFSATSYIDGQVDFRRHASALTGDLYETNTTTGDQFVGADPGRLPVGESLGPLTIAREGDLTVYSRPFANGTVYLEFGPEGNMTAMGVSGARRSP